MVGIDGSPAAFDACRQALRLADPGCPIDAVTVVHLADAIQTALDAPSVVDLLQQEADTAIAEAERILLGRGTCRAVNGFITTALLQEVERTRATLLALGAHHHSRAEEIVLGGPLGELLHRAPCSVLVSRPVDEPEAFPRSIVVGVDGSPAADDALAAALRLADRFACTVERVTAQAHPVDVLVSAAREADLLVVGSRGLHGLRAVGSVSERVAHEAGCPVLVVRLRGRA